MPGHIFISIRTLLHSERESVAIINNRAIPGNGEVAENVCYEWTTIRQAPIVHQPTVQNVAYERVENDTRADETHHYEAISDVTATQRDNYNTNLAATTQL